MSDFSGLNQDIADLQTEVAALGTQMDANFKALEAALAGGNQPAIDAARAQVQATIQALKDIGTRDTVVPPPAP